MNLLVLKQPLLTERYTQVLVDMDSVKFNAPHHFFVVKSEKHEDGQQDVVTEVHFQEGPIKEHGVNGCNNEDLINMVICRLESFQRSDYACKENQEAIDKLSEALMWLRLRTLKREQRNVEGTSAV